MVEGVFPPSASCSSIKPRKPYGASFYLPFKEHEQDIGESGIQQTASIRQANGWSIELEVWVLAEKPLRRPCTGDGNNGTPENAAGPIH